MKSIVRSFIKNINYKHIQKYIGRNCMHCKKIKYKKAGLFRLAFFKWKLKGLFNFCNNLNKMELYVFKHFNVVIMNIRIAALHIMLG